MNRVTAREIVHNIWIELEDHPIFREALESLNDDQEYRLREILEGICIEADE